MSEIMTVGGRPFTLSAASGSGLQLNDTPAQAPVGAPVFTPRGDAGVVLDGSAGVTSWTDSVTS